MQDVQAEATVKVSGDERLPALDLMRGVAILMILPANVASFSTPDMNPRAGADSWADHLVTVLTLFFVDGKFITLLSILFGAGLMIQALRAQAAGRPFGWFYTKRMGALFLIGLAHALLFWWGDILTSYAIVGLGALLLSRLGQRTLLRFIGGFLLWCYSWLLLFTLLIVIFGDVTSTPSEPQPPNAAATAQRNEGKTKSPAGQPESDSQRSGASPSPEDQFEQMGKAIEEYFSEENYVRIYRHGAFREMVLNRAIMLACMTALFWLMLGWDILACFLMGIYLLRQGIFHDADTHRPLLRKFIGWGLAVGVPFHVAALVAYARNPDGLLSYCLNYFGPLPLALAYLGALTFWSHSGRAEWLQSRLRAVGRLALTNYLMQSVLCGFIFYSYGLGLYGQMGRAASFGVVLLIWLAQVVVSPLWLRYFQIGPVEWLWRSLAEGRRRPFLRRLHLGM
jgi:uncharacterized protein